MKTITFTGAGSGALVGQAYEPNLVWPKLTYSAMIRMLDFENEAFREDALRRRAEVRGGGATPPFGEGDIASIGFVRDGYSWSTAGPFIGPAAVSYAARVHDLWGSSPQGALLAAQRYKAVAGEQVRGGKTYSTLTFTIPKVMQAVVWVDDRGFVPQVVAKIPNAVLGDMEIVTQFEEYREVAGLKFPLRIRQTQSGDELFDIAVHDVRVDLPSDTEVPAAVRAAKLSITTEKFGEGVWFLRGPTHNSVAIEMADQILIVESPLSDAFAEQIFAKANALVPAKTVQTVIATHHHFDHAGGLRYAASQGATLVVHELAKPFYDKAFSNPNRISPDSLALSGRTAKVVGVGAKHVFADGLRHVETHAIPDSVHARGFLLVYLPKEKILIEGDPFHIRPQTNPVRPLPVATEVNLIDNLKRLQLSVDRILPLHGRASSMQELTSRSGTPGLPR